MLELLQMLGIILFIGYLIVMLQAKKRVVARLNILLAPAYYFSVASIGGSDYYFAKAVLFHRLKDGKPLPDDPHLHQLIKTYNLLWLTPITLVAIAAPIYLLLYPQ